jgi:outer membrane lipoprotein-sorting protein
MRTLYILLTVFLTLPAFAQESAFQTFLKARTMQADFTQENHYPGIDNYTNSGKVYLVRPEQALWDYQTPEEFYLITPKEILHYNAELNQAVKMQVSADGDDLSGLLLGIFVNDAGISNDFEVDDQGETVILTPKKNVGVENIVIKMGKSIESIYTIDFSGNSVLISFQNIVLDKPVDGKIFDKTLPEGTEYFEQ